MQQPAVEKNNPLANYMREIQGSNAAAGLPAGRAHDPANVEQPTRVRSKAMATPLVVKPISAEERAELDRKAREIGILPKDELDELKDDDPEPENLLAPTAPSQGPARTFIPTPGSIRNPRAEVRATGLVGSATAANARPTLPDFKKVQSFDLITGTIYVDGMSFPIPPDDVLAMKSYAVQITLDHVVAQLAEALIEFGVPKASAVEAANKLRETVNNGRENVSEVPGGTPVVGVPPQRPEEEGLAVSEVSQPGEQGLPEVAEGTGTGAQE